MQSASLKAKALAKLKQFNLFLVEHRRSCATELDIVVREVDVDGGGVELSCPRCNIWLNARFTQDEARELPVIDDPVGFLRLLEEAAKQSLN